MMFFKATNNNDAFEYGKQSAEYVLHSFPGHGEQTPLDDFLCEISVACAYINVSEDLYEPFFNGAKVIWDEAQQRAREEAEREKQHKANIEKAVNLAAKIFKEKA